MYDAYDRDSFVDHVSEYAVQKNDQYEALAETFALATDPAYERWTLPMDIEELVFGRMLKEGD